jgi:hypothetical protein
LALEANPELTVEDLTRLLADGVSEHDHGVRLIDPAAVVRQALAPGAQPTTATKTGDQPALEGR